MIRLRACVLSTVLALMSLALGSHAHAETCPVKTPGFSVELTREAYTILYEGKPVHIVSGNDLLHTIFGGKAPYIDCSAVKSTTCFFAIIVGWKLDLLLGFGPYATAGGELALNTMRWFPHDGTFRSVNAADRELDVTFGPMREKRMRLCWNPGGDDKWRFSSNRRVARSCDTGSLPDASQGVVYTRVKAPSSDACITPVSINGPGRRALV